MATEIKGEDITQYLDDRDDFDLELFAFRTLREHGWFAELGGTYVDPVLGKPRQYDVRARVLFSPGIERELYFAVECKSLTKENPLVVSCVPRPIRESLHDVIIRRPRRAFGDETYEVFTSQPSDFRLYGADEMVGKSATQIRWDRSGKLAASDAETYDKWAQALASAAELVEVAAHREVRDKSIFAFVMPVLLVNDATLWSVDYDAEGKRSAPQPASSAVLFVDRKVGLKSVVRPSTTYHLSHLHIYTRTSFERMLTTAPRPTDHLLEKIFRQAVHYADEQKIL
jgi:hypothetical protein